MSAKTLLIGIICVAAVCYITCYAELVITFIQIGFLQFLPVIVGMFLFIIIANNLFKRILVRFGLNSQQIMVIYCMMLLAAMISSAGVKRYLGRHGLRH